MSEKENKTIVFVETKRRCDELTRKGDTVKDPVGLEDRREQDILLH